MENNQTSSLAARRTSYYSEKTAIESIRACLTISRACQDSATGYRIRWKEKKQTGKSVRGKRKEWIGLKLSDAVRESEERERRRKLAARTSVGAPTVGYIQIQMPKDWFQLNFNSRKTKKKCI